MTMTISALQREEALPKLRNLGIQSIRRWGQMPAALQMLDDNEWEWGTADDVADFLERRFFTPDGYMPPDDEMEVHATLEWLWKAGTTLDEDVSGISLILDFMDYNSDAVIEEWRAEWEAKR